jgi:hypothetical protein
VSSLPSVRVAAVNAKAMTASRAHFQESCLLKRTGEYRARS